MNEVEKKDASTNTEPINVKLYFDENNSIKWKIEYNNTNTNIPELAMNNNGSSSSYNNEIIKHDEPMHHNDQHSMFSMKYIIGSTKIEENCENIKIVPLTLSNEKYSNNTDDSYDNFDYFHYNYLEKFHKIKNKSWKHYMVNNTDKYCDGFSLNSEQQSLIEAMIQAIEHALYHNYPFIVINISPYNENQSAIKKIKNSDNYKEYDILILNGNIIDKSLCDIYSFAIKIELYDLFLNKLMERTTTWQQCLMNIVSQISINRYELII